MTTRYRARLASRFPLRLRRWRTVLPEEAGTGATPVRRAKAPSPRRRSEWSPAAVRRAPAVSVPTPLTATKAGAAAATMGPNWASRAATSRSRAWWRRASERSARRVAAAAVRGASGVRSRAAAATSAALAGAQAGAQGVGGGDAGVEEYPNQN